MKKLWVVFFSIILVFVFYSCNKKTATPTTANKISLESQKDKDSYSFGYKSGMSLKNKNITEHLTLETFLAGIRDAVLNNNPSLKIDEIQRIHNSFNQKINQIQMQKFNQMAQENIKIGKEFLKNNGQNSNVITTKSGLQYTIIKEGNGPRPKSTDTIRAHYRGTLINGTEFDSSIKRGKPTEFGLNGVIKGWTEGLQLMNVGSKFRFFIPSVLAYGSRVRPGSVIPPNAVLIFDIELLKIVKNNQK